MLLILDNAGQLRMLLQYGVQSGSEPLRKFMSKDRKVNSYLSPESQNGIIDAIYKHCLANLAERVKKAK